MLLVFKQQGINYTRGLKICSSCKIHTIFTCTQCHSCMLHTIDCMVSYLDPCGAIWVLIADAIGEQKKTLLLHTSLLVMNEVY